MDNFENKLFDTEPYRTNTYNPQSFKAPLIISITSLVLIVTFYILYFSLWYNHVDGQGVQDNLQNTNATLATLVVSGDSSLEQTTYKTKIEQIAVQTAGGTSTRNLTSSESGTTFVLSMDTTFTSTRYTYYLPEATGSGIFYEFLFNDNVLFDSAGTAFMYWIGNNTDSPDNIIGNASFAIQGLATGETDGSASADSNTFSTVFAINENVPFQEGLGGVSAGLYSGSLIKFTDIKTKLWQVEGNMIGNSGMSVLNFATPFINL